MTPSGETPTAPPWDQQKLYGRRQAKNLRPRPQDLLDRALPKVAVTPNDVAEVVSAHGGPVWLEVGFGGGEHLAWQAGRNTGVLMLGAEPFLNGVAKLLDLIETDAIPNIRVCQGDVRPLMTALPDRCLSRLFVLHPDPWPKSRHRKRRMISARFLEEAARLLRPGSELRIASDIPDYIEWSLTVMAAHIRRSDDFAWTATRPSDWQDRPDDWPETRYEAKAKRAGRPPCYLTFVRR